MKQKLTIIKVGGKVVEDENSCKTILESFSEIDGLKILIHGGGAIAKDVASSLGVKTEYVDGRRITSKEDLDVVTMVYAGLLNKKIVASLQSLGINAVGISGADGNTIEAVKRPVTNIDYGFAGDVIKVNNGFLYNLLTSDTTPVICSITHDKKGQLLNTNADTVASEVAISLSSLFDIKLIFCFDKNGVLKDSDNNESVIPTITKESYNKLKSDGVVSDGMLPKLDNAFRCLNLGVSEVELSHAVNINNNIGTLITSKVNV